MKNLSRKRRAIFLDKDGTLVQDVPYNVDPTRVTLMRRAADGLKRMHADGYALVVVSNQSGVARGYFSEPALQLVEQRLHDILDEIGVPLTGFYYCPHHPDGVVSRYAIDCACRKPEAGMLLRAAREHAISLEDSWFIGDILDDIEAGRRAGCRTILLSNGNETQWRVNARRTPDFMAADLLEAADFIRALDGVPVA